MGCVSSKSKAKSPVSVVIADRKEEIREETPAEKPVLSAKIDEKSNKQHTDSLENTPNDHPAPKPPAVVHSDPAPGPGLDARSKPGQQIVTPPEYHLEQMALSGKWYRLVNAVSEEIPPELNKEVEVGFHTGQGKYQFEYGEQQCEMDYAEGRLTMKRESGNKEFDLVRKVFDFCSIEWTPEDGIPRPFPEAIESYLVSRRPLDSPFSLNSTSYVASLSTLQLRNLSTGSVYPLTIIEE